MTAEGELEDEGDPSDQSGLDFLAGVMNGPRSVELSRHFLFARDAVIQLRDYVPIMMDANERFESEPAFAVADRSLAAKSLDEATRLRIRNIFDLQMKQMEKSIESLPLDKAISNGFDEMTVLADPFAALGQMFDLSTMSRMALDIIGNITELSYEEQAYWWEYSRAHERLSHRQLLLRTQYVVASSLVQPALASLLLLVRRSEEDKSEAPVDRATLDQEIANLLGQGPAVWRERLVKRFKIASLDNAIDWVQLNHMWHRRNLLVHRGGLIDAKYKAAVPGAAPVGGTLDLSVEDVLWAFDFVGGIRMGFLIAAADLVTPGIARRFAAAHGDIAVEDLDKERWWLAEGTARAALAYAATDRVRAFAQVNLWLARSGRLGAEVIRGEVETWATSELDPLFGLAKSVLLGDEAVALDQIGRLVATGELTRRSLEYWLNRPGFRDCSGYWVTASRAGSV